MHYLYIHYTNKALVVTVSNKLTLKSIPAMRLKKFDFESCISLLHIISTPFGIGAISSPNLKSIFSKIRNGILPIGKYLNYLIFKG